MDFTVKREESFCPFKTLGLELGCTVEGINNAWKRVRGIHPDKVGKEDVAAVTEMCKRIHKSRQLLLDPELTRIYVHHAYQGGRPDCSKGWNAVSKEESERSLHEKLTDMEFAELLVKNKQDAEKGEPHQTEEYLIAKRKSCFKGDIVWGQDRGFDNRRENAGRCASCTSEAEKWAQKERHLKNRILQIEGRLAAEKERLDRAEREATARRQELETTYRDAHESLTAGEARLREEKKEMGRLKAELIEWRRRISLEVDRKTKESASLDQELEAKGRRCSEVREQYRDYKAKVEVLEMDKKKARAAKKEAEKDLEAVREESRRAKAATEKARAAKIEAEKGLEAVREESRRAKAATEKEKVQQREIKRQLEISVAALQQETKEAESNLGRVRVETEEIRRNNDDAREALESLKLEREECERNCRRLEAQAEDATKKYNELQKEIESASAISLALTTETDASRRKLEDVKEDIAKAEEAHRNILREVKKLGYALDSLRTEAATANSYLDEVRREMVESELRLERRHNDVRAEQERPQNQSCSKEEVEEGGQVVEVDWGTSSEVFIAARTPPPHPPEKKPKVTASTTTEEPPRFQCPECKRAFECRDSWRRCKRSHDPSTHKKCPVCCKSFTRADLLKRHLANVHTPKPEPKEP